MPILIDNIQSRKTTIIIPMFGHWLVSCQLNGTISLSERTIVVQYDKLKLVGDLDLSSSGNFIDSAHIVIVGGLALNNPLPGRTFANDLGITTSTIASDLSTEVNLPIFVGQSFDRNLGRIWVSSEGASAGESLTRASRTGLTNQVKWYVDETNSVILDRRAQPMVECVILDYEPIDSVARVECDSSALIVGGLVRSERLARQMQIHKIVVEAVDNRIDKFFYLGNPEGSL